MNRTAAIGFGISLLGAYLVLEARSPFESAPGEVFLLVAGEDTAFAPGYSKDSFAQIAVGQTRADVTRTLGQPTWDSDPGKPDAVLHYSASPSSTHYRQRLVRLQDGVVSKVITKIWFD